MNGIENIIAHIEENSAAECEKIRAEAAAKCEQILSESSEAEKTEYDAIMSQGAVDAAQRYERLGNVATLESKKKLLSVKQELVAAAFKQAETMLAALPEDEYLALIVKLTVLAAQAGDEQVILSERDLQKIGSSVIAGANKALASLGRTANLVLHDKPRDISGGVILTNGEIETNCSFETLVQQYKNELSADVAAALFE